MNDPNNPNYPPNYGQGYPPYQPQPGHDPNQPYDPNHAGDYPPQPGPYGAAPPYQQPYGAPPPKRSAVPWIVGGCGGLIVLVVAAIALLSMAGRRGALNNDYFVGNWAPTRACEQVEFTSFKSDGSYTAPMNATRRALGVWSFENGVLTMGNVFQQGRLRITRVADDEMRSAPVEGGSGVTFYRC